MCTGRCICLLLLGLGQEDGECSQKVVFCFFSVELRESAVDSLCWFTVFLNLFFGFFHYLNALFYDWEMYCQTNFVVQSVSQDIPKFAVTASFFRTLR